MRLTPLVKGSDLPTKVGLLLAHGSWIPFLLPQVTYMGASWS